jgi:hypothetical protein
MHGTSRSKKQGSYLEKMEQGLKAALPDKV